MAGQSSPVQIHGKMNSSLHLTCTGFFFLIYFFLFFTPTELEIEAIYSRNQSEEKWRAKWKTLAVKEIQPSLLLSICGCDSATAHQMLRHQWKKGKKKMRGCCIKFALFPPKRDPDWQRGRSIHQNQPLQVSSEMRTYRCEGKRI